MILLFYIPICLFCAYYWGNRTRAGFGWSLFFCLFFCPLIGSLIVSYSRHENKDFVKRKPNVWSILFAIIFLSISIFFLRSIIISCKEYSTTITENIYLKELLKEKLNTIISVSFLCVGFLGLSIYISRFLNLINIDYANNRVV
jgi:intracellular septation protein A